MKRILVQRYDNELDILDIKRLGYSETFQASRDNDFEMLVVVPTVKAKTNIAVVAIPTSGQKPAGTGQEWSGRPDRYTTRIDVKDVCYTTVGHIKAAFESAGYSWKGQWPYRVVELDEELFLNSSDLAKFEQSVERASSDSNSKGYYEGTDTRIPVNRYERSRTARKKCVEHYGALCHGCGFDFSKAYGTLANGYIHVHHLRPLSMIKSRHKVDPIQDLRPVCANCHAVLHLQNPLLSIEELKASLSFQLVWI